MNTLDLTDAAALLHMSEDALMRKARAGIIPGCKPGRQWVFLEVDLIEWMRSQYSQTPKTRARQWSSNMYALWGEIGLIWSQIGHNADAYSPHQNQVRARLPRR